MESLTGKRVFIFDLETTGLPIMKNVNKKREYDDYKNNAEAYLFFSLSWFVTAPMFIVVATIQLLYKFAQWFLKYPNV